MSPASTTMAKATTPAATLSSTPTVSINQQRTKAEILTEIVSDNICADSRRSCAIFPIQNYRKIIFSHHFSLSKWSETKNPKQKKPWKMHIAQPSNTRRQFWTLGDRTLNTHCVQFCFSIFFSSYFCFVLNFFLFFYSVDIVVRARLCVNWQNARYKLLMHVLCDWGGLRHSMQISFARNKMLSVRKNLTEILLEVTSEEISAIAQDTLSKVRSKGQKSCTIFQLYLFVPNFVA